MLEITAFAPKLTVFGMAKGVKNAPAAPAAVLPASYSAAVPGTSKDSSPAMASCVFLVSQSPKVAAPRPATTGTRRRIPAVTGVTGGMPETAALPACMPLKKAPADTVDGRMSRLNPSLKLASDRTGFPCSSRTNNSRIASSVNGSPSKPRSVRIGAFPSRKPA